MLQNMEVFCSNLMTNHIITRLRHIAGNIAARRALRSAHGVIATSNFVHHYLSEKLSVPREKISQIYFGNQLPKGGIL